MRNAVTTGMVVMLIATGIPACSKGRGTEYDFEVRKVRFRKGMGIGDPEDALTIINRSALACRNAVLVLDRHYEAELARTSASKYTSDENPADIAPGAKVTVADVEAPGIAGWSVFRDSQGRYGPRFSAVSEIEIRCVGGGRGRFKFNE